MPPSLDPSIAGERIRAAIRDIPDFPRPGVGFKDVTPVLADAALFTAATHAMAAPWTGRGITHVVGIESRGFVFGAPVAQHLGAGFIPVRKPGKLPFRRHRVDYALEYGSDGLEIHEDACSSASVVLVVDDVLATGGTAAAAADLIGALGATLAGFSFLIELGFLGGANRLAGIRHEAVVRY